MMADLMSRERDGGGGGGAEGGDAARLTVVFDRQGFHMGLLDLELWRRLGARLSDHYPERLHVALVYPSGFLFRSLWRVVVARALLRGRG